MLGRKERGQLELFISGSLKQLVPDDHVLVRVDRVLDLSWLRMKSLTVIASRMVDGHRSGSGGAFNARGLADRDCS